jgi:hypothetical protein
MSNTNATESTALSAPSDQMRAAKLTEMKQWAKSFTINKPVPQDLLPLLTKDDTKQVEIMMRNTSLERGG